MERMLVSGVAADKNTARITVTGVEDAPGSEYKIFDALANNSINVEAILQTAARDGKKDVSILVSRDCLERGVSVLKEHQARFKAQDIEVDEHIAKVSIVGASIQSNPGVASAMFEALYNAGINIKMTATNELRITVIVDEDEMEKAVRVVHAALIE